MEGAPAAAESFSQAQAPAESDVGMGAWIADLHIHSRYARATSGACVPETLAFWAQRKGLQLIGTGDFTHPAWRQELALKLAPCEEGLYRLKDEFWRDPGVAGMGDASRFVVSGEISSIYKQDGRVRKVHNLILLPGLAEGEVLTRRLERIGNLHSDGRPILGLSSRDLLEITLEACPQAIFIPAHIWTPHFSLFGAYSGFERIEDCFGDLTPHIGALETGLSSDPAMNARLSALDGFRLVSNSDAHSPANLGREANLLDTDLSYAHLARALDGRDPNAFRGTIEFFPEEGKYHFNGHRDCKACLSPEQTRDALGRCPVCGKQVTVGVLHRVEELADRPAGAPCVRPFERLIPLAEVIAVSMGLTTAARRVQQTYESMLSALGPEMHILRAASLPDIQIAAGPLLAEGIRRLREGRVDIRPGYDGEYGRVSLFAPGEIERMRGQISLFEGSAPAARKRRAKAASAAQPEPAQKEEPVAVSRLPYGLNGEQWAAASAGEGPVAVIAGPGTGKTKTLTARVAYLIERGVTAASITAVTFTNQAAGELRGRLRQLLGAEVASAAAIGTFHQLCLASLSASGAQTDIISEPDALALIAEILNELCLTDAPRDIQTAISRHKNGAPERAGEILPDGVLSAYDRRLEAVGALDFDDILLRALARAEGTGEGPCAPDGWLFVDEFQDISDVQYRLVVAWAQSCRGVFVIGDPDQSIYGFRGASPAFFQRFVSQMSGALCIRLRCNYRSTPQILRCAGALLAAAEGQPARHDLLPQRSPGPLVRVVRVQDARQEAQFIAQEIGRLVGGLDMLGAHEPAPSGNGARGMRGFGDIAVLYRTNRQAEALEQRFNQEGIAYAVGGRHDYLADAQVRGVVAFFRYLHSPLRQTSLGAFLRTLGGFRADEAQEALARCRAAGPSVLDAADALEHLTPGQAGAPCAAALLRRFAPLARAGAPAAVLRAFAADCALQGSPAVDLLLDTAVMYEDMSALLASLLLGRESDVRRSGKRYAREAVSLLTLHGAKGLEFPAVFLCGVNDGLLPYRGKRDSDAEEERRLLFVGMTRARDELTVMTSAHPSPFLAALPEDAVLRQDAYAARAVPGFRQLSLFDR